MERQQPGLHFCKVHNRMTEHDWYSDVTFVDLLNCDGQEAEDALQDSRSYFNCGECEEFDDYCKSLSTTEEGD